MKVGIEWAGNKQWEQNETKYTGKKQVKCEENTRPGKWSGMQDQKHGLIKEKQLEYTKTNEHTGVWRKKMWEKDKDRKKTLNEPHMDIIFK